jgi:hypothetical protein
VKSVGKTKGHLSSPSRFAGFWALIWISSLAFRISCSAAELPLDEPIPPLRPPRGPLPPTFWEAWVGWVIGGGALFFILLAGLIWLLVRAKAPLIIPPEAQARNALGALRGQPESGLLLSRVSQIVRAYFSAAFALPAGELTTSELCRAIEERQEISVQLKGEVSDFLRSCDERKFSPTPAPAPIIGAVIRADKLIETAEAQRAELQAAAQAKETAGGKQA